MIRPGPPTAKSFSKDRNLTLIIYVISPSEATLRLGEMILALADYRQRTSRLPSAIIKHPATAAETHH
jgi:hypothetical protein